MRNLIAGERYLEHCGIINITSNNPDLHCTLEFKEGGFWGTTRDQVSVTITHSPSNTETNLRGLWHHSFARALDPTAEHLHVLWRAAPLPPNARQYYGLTEFAITLNEITPDIAPFLPPSDSRLRPDQRALEDGRVDDADAEKERIEGEQRERRKAREKDGEDWIPRWFESVRDKDGEEEWVYKGGYWEARERKDWSNVQKLW